MVYHFVKHIGIDVEADSLEQAMEFACDIDNFDDDIEDTIADYYEDSDFVDSIDSYSVHNGYTDYAGYTDDDDNEGFDAEENFFNHLVGDETADADDEDDCSADIEIDASNPVDAFVLAILSALIG